MLSKAVAEETCFPYSASNSEKLGSVFSYYRKEQSSCPSQNQCCKLVSSYSYTHSLTQQPVPSSVAL